LLSSQDACRDILGPAHEIGRELLHRGARRSETTHTVRETEAEAIAFIVSSAIGFDTDTSSSDCIQLHSGDKATIAESLTIVQQTAQEILAAITAPRLNEVGPEGAA
jgi:hypothetical protein